MVAPKNSMANIYFEDKGRLSFEGKMKIDFGRYRDLAVLLQLNNY